MSGRTDDGASERHVASEIDITGDGKVVKLYDLRDFLEALLELLDLNEGGCLSAFSLSRNRKLPGGQKNKAASRWSDCHGLHGTHLLKVIAQLDHRSRLKHPVLIDDELTMLERVDIALNQQQVGTALDGQETATRHVDPVCIPEMLDCRARSSLELYDRLPVVVHLGVNDDLEFHAFRVHDMLERCGEKRVNNGAAERKMYRAGPFRLIHRLFVLKILNLRTEEMNE